jgi:hypothetical protein
VDRGEPHPPTTKAAGTQRYVHVIFGQFLPELTEEEELNGWFQQESATAHTARMSSGIELSAAVFGQHVHPILILVIFFFLV